jgi:two-component sensor histidine kinase
VRDETGAVREWVGVHADITEAREAEERRKRLLDELNHRVKNSLATVQSIALQTSDSSESPRTFIREFNERILALSQAHNLLTRSDWEGAGLRDLVEQELAPYRGLEASRFNVRGVEVRLRPKETLALGMALHELATNAAKYGAFSAEAGSVDVAWERREEAGESWLRLVWVESGGPPVRPPRRRGFGSRLIERGLGHELRAKAALDFQPGGLACIIDTPLLESPS